MFIFWHNECPNLARVAAECTPSRNHPILLQYFSDFPMNAIDACRAEGTRKGMLEVQTIAIKWKKSRERGRGRREAQDEEDEEEEEDNVDDEEDEEKEEETFVFYWTPPF